MTTHNLTIGELAERSAKDHKPPVDALWKRIGGQDKEMENLVAGTLVVIQMAKTRRDIVDALVGLLEMGTIVGYYGALQTYDDLMGLGDGGPPC